MKDTVTRAITIGDVKFWIIITTLVVAGATAHVSLRENVNAMTSREQANKITFMDFVEVTTEKLDKIIGNQIIIATELGIEIER